MRLAFALALLLCGKPDVYAATTCMVPTLHIALNEAENGWLVQSCNSDINSGEVQNKYDVRNIIDEAQRVGYALRDFGNNWLLFELRLQ
jgi:hypothetical protein